MSSLISDVIPADAPDRALREAAAERAAGLAVPSPELEVWRYSRIAELDLAASSPAAVRTTVTGADQVPVADPALIAELVAGMAVHDVFDELNAAYHRTVAISVPAGKVLADPIVVTHHVEGGTAEHGVALYPRLVVHGGADSEFTVIERFESSDDTYAVVVPRLLVHASQAARVSYLGVNLLGANTWQLGHQQSTGERDSTTLLGTVALGGDYARVRTDARVTGQGASTKQVALYYADGNQMHDFRTLQDHMAPKTNSDLLFKGAVQNTAKSVYTGLIRIRENARGSVAFQTNRNLTLSEGAWAESVPNLDIQTNDVKCSHASTVGPVDDEQRFYLESRGIPPEVAERLIVLGFFDDVLNLLPVSSAGTLRADLRARVAEKLQHREPDEVSR